MLIINACCISLITARFLEDVYFCLLKLLNIEWLGFECHLRLEMHCNLMSRLKFFFYHDNDTQNTGSRTFPINLTMLTTTTKKNCSFN